MAFFRFLFNLLWFVLGGVFMGLAWWLAGLVCFISLVGIPWGRACFVIGTFTFFPFGKQAVNRKTMTGQSDIGTGTLGLICNILWFVLIGVWLAIGHIASALACFVTIIGIPFGIQHLKLALISLAPIGQMIVTNQEAESGRYIR
ncbi:YccF domain-containing protein [Aeromonas sp. S13(2024)]|uniref:YccF domain-containing protein n=1 Tax=Aeromonas sp. S13(2024) TaxID=3242886 RepID=UPI0035271D30